MIAKLTISIGDDAKEYVKIVGKGERFKRGSASFSSKKGTIEVVAKAGDATSLMASLGSAIKQLKVVSSVDSVVK